MALIGDAAGYVTKCSGEGIYFAAKSGRMCAEAIVERSQKGRLMQHKGIAAQLCICMAATLRCAGSHSQPLLTMLLLRVYVPS